MTKFKLVRTRSWPAFLSHQPDQAISKERGETLVGLVEEKTWLEQIRGLDPEEFEALQQQPGFGFFPPL